jgi:hypothetical protein
MVESENRRLPSFSATFNAQYECEEPLQVQAIFVALRFGASHCEMARRDFKSLTPASVLSSFSAKSVRLLADDNFLRWLSLAAFCADLLSFTKLQQKFWGTAAATERPWHFAILKTTPARTGTMTVRGRLVAIGTARSQIMNEEPSAPCVPIAELRLRNESATLAARGSL